MWSFRHVADICTEAVTGALPQSTRETFALRGFAIKKIPLILYVGARVASIDTSRCVIGVPLNWRTRNHVRCLYVGALVVGADLACGLLAFHLAAAKKAKVEILFKGMQAEFLKRAEGDCLFTCTDGVAIDAAIDRALATQERVNLPAEVVATVPDRLGDAPVAKFTMTLSLKPR